MPSDDRPDPSRFESLARRYEAIVDASTHGIVVTDIDGQLLELNTAFADLLQEDPDALAGQSLLRGLTDPDDQAAERGLFQSLIRGDRQGYDIEKHLLTADQQRIVVSVKARLLADPQNEPTGVLFVVEDLSSIHQSQQALRSSELKMRMISDAVVDAVIMFDHKGCVEHWSRAAEQVFGYAADEALGRPVHSLILPDEDAAAAETELTEFGRSGTGGFVGRIVSRIGQRRSGERFPMELTVSPMRIDGQWWAVGIVRDVTNQRQSEDTARQTAQRAEQMAEQLKLALKDSEEHRLTAETLATKAREADRAKTNFLTDMSHEIRTPMTAVLGYTDILLRGDLSPEEQWNFLQSIKTNGRALLDLINQILDQSKIEAGRMDAQTILIPPWEVIQEVDTLMRPRVENKGLDFNIRYLGAIPELIRTDAMKLRQILVNLVGNAIKFTEQGEIEITTRCLDDAQGRLNLAITVNDTGSGIPQAMLDSIFSPYQQDTKVAMHQTDSTGLGLSISRKLAELLGGDITVRSQPGMGSSFTVMIDPGPLDDVRMVAPPRALRVDRPKPGHAPTMQLSGRVMVVEDTVATAILLEFLLKDMGLTVDVAENGRICCDKVFDAASRGLRYDLIIMDIHMPEMDGYQATRILRELNYDVPILAVTARAMPSDRDRCAKAGCDDYIAKPIDLEHFAERVRAFIQTPREARVLRR